MLHDNIELNFNISGLLVTKRVCTDSKINNIKNINDMVSFSNHYNSIFNEKILSKNKICKDAWFLIIPLLDEPNIFSSAKNSLSRHKHQSDVGGVLT